MADTAEPQHSEASPRTGRWTNLLLAVREALDEWDTGEPFDPDSSRGGDLMDALRGPVAAVDLIEAKKVDAALDLLPWVARAAEILDRLDFVAESREGLRLLAQVEDA